MTRGIRILTRLYASMLGLYPRAYWVEYGDELKAVFNLAMGEAAQRGGLSVMWLSLRELRDLPRAIIHEHWQERRRRAMAQEPRSLFTFEPGSLREAMMGVAPFLMFGAFPAFLGYLRVHTAMPQWLEVILALGLLGALLALFVIGVVKRLPRWFFPCMGLPLPLLSVYVLSSGVAVGARILPMSTESWLLRESVYGGQLWGGLLAIELFVVLISRMLPPPAPIPSASPAGLDTSLFHTLRSYAIRPSLRFR